MSEQLPQSSNLLDQTLSDGLRRLLHSTSDDQAQLTPEQQNLLRRLMYSRMHFDDDLKKQFLDAVPKERRQFRSTAAQENYYSGSFDFQAEIDAALERALSSVPGADTVTLRDFCVQTITAELLERRTRWGEVGKSKEQMGRFYQVFCQAATAEVVKILQARIKESVAQDRTSLATGDANTARDILCAMDQVIKDNSHVEVYEAPSEGGQSVYTSSATRNADRGRRHGGYTPGSGGGRRGR